MTDDGLDDPMTTSDKLASQYADVVRGVPVDESRHVSSADDRAVYANLEREVAAIRDRNPAAAFSIPNEIPGALET